MGTYPNQFSFNEANLRLRASRVAIVSGVAPSMSIVLDDAHFYLSWVVETQIDVFVDDWESEDYPKDFDWQESDLRMSALEAAAGAVFLTNRVTIREGAKLLLFNATRTQLGPDDLPPGQQNLHAVQSQGKKGSPPGHA